MSEIPEQNGRRISRMDSQTAKSISSGQVITNLSNVVKELLENGIDAKATVITIRVKEMGKEEVEVIDNGFGISEKDFESLAKRNCTSKLNDFEDLQSISSFGFRGEALNSLCILSEVSIQTRHFNDVFGSNLKFDSNANIISKEVMARNVGTTVVIKKLFNSIPVRKKEFHSNIKREFDKMVRLVYGYCIGSVGLRITLTNQMTNKSTQTVLSSPGRSIRDNIIEVFDLKQINCLIEFINSSQTIDNCDSDKNIEISGFISKCDSGCGRSATDRQFYYVNRRPCDMKNISKFINDIYHKFNKNQYPFVLLNIKINQKCVDFNLSPDKRQLLLQNEDKIFELIENCFNELYNRENCCQLDSMTNYVTKGSQFSQKRIIERVDNEIETINSSPLKIIRSRSPCDSPFKETTSRDSIIISKSPNNFQLIDSDNCEKTKIKSKSPLNLINDYNTNSVRKSDFNFKPISDDIPVIVRDVPFYSTENFVFEAKDFEDFDFEDKPNVDTIAVKSPIKCLTECVISDLRDSDEEQEGNDYQNINTDIPTNSETNITANIRANDSISDESNDIIVDINTEQINQLFVNSIERKDSTNKYKFSAKIQSSQNERAEQELSHELNKNSFEEMKIIGQFNEGFIITKLGQNLFIVDQHASNERFNYERLLSETRIETQNLVLPMSLQLSAANENVVINHLTAFKNFGFGIVVNEEAAAGHRIHLSGIPISKEWTAGKEDIEEIVGKIIDTPIELLRDYKLINFKRVIASRACRSSVMIGSSLFYSQMKTIVSQMSHLQNPWHCAHNRPTIRHLIDLTDICSLFDI